MLFHDLETARLKLKNISSIDRDFIFKQFSDQHITRYLFDSAPLEHITDADKIIEIFLEPEPRTHHRWILIQKSDNTIIGTCGFHRWDKLNATIEVGYDLQTAFQGIGYMQEALSAIILFATNTLNVQTIIACIYPENIKSIAAVEKLGFQFTGKTKSEYFQGTEYLHKLYFLECNRL